VIYKKRKEIGMKPSEAAQVFKRSCLGERLLKRVLDGGCYTSSELAELPEFHGIKKATISAAIRRFGDSKPDLHCVTSGKEYWWGNKKAIATMLRCVDPETKEGK